MTKRKANPTPRGGPRPGAGRKQQYLRIAIPLGVELTIMQRNANSAMVDLYTGTVTAGGNDDYPVVLLRVRLADGGTLEIANLPPLRE